MGRKKLPDNVGRTANLHVRLAPPFKAWLIRWAKSEGVSVSELVVDEMTRAAKRKKIEPPPRSEPLP